VRRLGDVAPGAAGDDEPHRHGADAVLGGDRAMSLSVRGEPPHFDDVGLGDLSSPRAAPVRVSTLGLTVDHVLLMSAEEQVVRPHAISRVAAVKGVHPDWDRPEVQFPREAMRAHRPAANFQCAIAGGAVNSGPSPTSVGLDDTGPKSLFGRQARDGREFTAAAPLLAVPTAVSALDTKRRAACEETRLPLPDPGLKRHQRSAFPALRTVPSTQSMRLPRATAPVKRTHRRHHSLCTTRSNQE
jgi:hypothetical protein